MTEVLEGKGRLYLVDDPRPIGEVSYRLVKRKPRGSYREEWNCEPLRFQTKYRELEEAGTSASKEVVLQLQDGRRARLLMELQVASVRSSEGLTPTLRYKCTVLSAPE